jgi:predicted glycosyltransferase
LHAAIDSFRPRVILVDKHPFGALGELTQSLHMIRDYGGRAVLGLRDILDEPGRVKNEWASQDFFSKVNSFYDLVLVYGERSVFDPVNEYQMPDEVAQNVRFCGYVVGCEVHKDQGASTDSISAKLETRKVPAVLATAGGGEDGFELIETFLKASAGAPWEGIAVAGPMTPEHEALRLQELARRAKVTLHSFLPHLSNLYWSVDCLVCMGGYNTLAEGVSRGVPIVCVPRVTPRSEQSLRAHAFERLGLLRAVAPDQLSVQAMRQSILRTLGSSRQGLLDRARQVLTFDGARQAASHLLALAAIASDAKVSSQVVAV